MKFLGNAEQIGSLELKTPISQKSYVNYSNSQRAGVILNFTAVLFGSC